MNKKRKNGFLTFCFSFMPGMGEMYLGFMKMGVSLMGMFFALIALSNLLYINAFVYAAVVLWFYSFFHVHNLAGLTDAEYMNMEDEYLFHLDALLGMKKENLQKNRKTVAVIFILAGILLLWNGVKAAIWPFLSDSAYMLLSRLENTVPQMLIGGAILFAGFVMIKGKKEELEKEELEKEELKKEEPEKEEPEQGEEKAEENNTDKNEEKSV